MGVVSGPSAEGTWSNKHSSDRWELDPHELMANSWHTSGSRVSSDPSEKILFQSPNYDELAVV